MPAIDPQPLGNINDGHEAGAIRCKPVSGDLVPEPFLRGQFRLATAGTQASGYREQGPGGDPFNIHSGIGIDLVKPAGGVGTYAEITHWFYGRKYGLIFALPTNADTPYPGQPDFSVAVDGAISRVSNYSRYQIDGAVNVSVGEGWGLWQWADDLPDGIHEARITCLPRASGTGTGSDNYWFFAGYLAERRVGYLPPTPSLLPLPAAVLTTSLVNFPNTPYVPTNLTAKTFGTTLRRFRKVQYRNTSASAVTVTITQGNVEVATLVLAAAGSAGDSGSFDPGESVVYDSSQATTHAYSWAHKASAGSAVNFLLLGGY